MSNSSRNDNNLILSPANDQRSRRIDLLLSGLVLGGILAVAYADSLVDTVSLGYLYLIPLALSASTHRLRTSFFLVGLCAVLHDWLGPYQHSGWPFLVRNLLTPIGFGSVVLAVYRLSRQRSALAEIIRQQRDELASELKLAADVQNSLLPDVPPSLAGFDLAGRTKAAKIVGGDYFDFLDNPSGNNVGFVIADVAGKGVSAALLMTSVVAALRMALRTSVSPEEVLESINEVLCDVTRGERFVTLFYGELDPQSYSFRYANAGHPPALLLRTNPGETMLLETGGTPLGLFSETNFDGAWVDLKAGDILALYTDGVVESQNASGEEFGRERLSTAIRANRHLSASRILDELYTVLEEYRGNDSLQDDTTLVIFKVLE